MSGHVNSPIFVEYYPHTDCDCFKVRLPWTRYREHVVVLCEASCGIKEATKLARRELSKHLRESLEQMPEGFTTAPHGGKGET